MQPATRSAPVAMNAARVPNASHDATVTFTAGGGRSEQSPMPAPATAAIAGATIRLPLGDFRRVEPRRRLRLRSRSPPCPVRGPPSASGGVGRGSRHVPVARARAAGRRARRPLSSGAGSWPLTNLGRALVLVTLALLVASHHINLPLLIALVFVNGGARAIYYSASQATVPELVEPHSFPRANGLLSGTEAATEHLGGPILGALAFAVTKALPFFADAVGGRSRGPFAARLPHSAPGDRSRRTARSSTASASS